MACIPNCAFVHLREGAASINAINSPADQFLLHYPGSHTLGNYSRGSKRLQEEGCEGESYSMNMDFVKVNWDQNHCDLNK